jgi:hypothetical protein
VTSGDGAPIKWKFWGWLALALAWTLWLIASMLRWTSWKLRRISFGVVNRADGESGAVLLGRKADRDGCGGPIPNAAH